MANRRHQGFDAAGPAICLYTKPAAESGPKTAPFHRPDAAHYEAGLAIGVSFSAAASEALRLSAGNGTRPLSAR